MTTEPFEPTHTVPPDGVATWATPNPALAPDNRLGAGLPVQLLREHTGWGHVRCSNGWEAWVDARLLVAIPAPTPPTAMPAEVTAPQPMPTEVAPPQATPAPAEVVPTPPPPPPPPPPPAAVEPAPPPAAEPEFAPTHLVPPTGLTTRERPDPKHKPDHRLDPGLPLHVVERAGDWARVRCSNGWETWVDGRNLAPR